MAIVNLIIKPFTSFVLYRMYQDRGGNYSDFGISGIPGIPNLGGSSGKFAFETKPVQQVVSIRYNTHLMRMAPFKVCGYQLDGALVKGYAGSRSKAFKGPFSS